MPCAYRPTRSACRREPSWPAPGTPVDDFLRMVERETRIACRSTMTTIGGGGSVATAQCEAQRVVLDRAGKHHRTDLEIFRIPAGSRDSDLETDFRIAVGPCDADHATESRQSLDNCAIGCTETACGTSSAVLIVADDNDRFSRSEQEANADAATNHKPVATTIGPNTPGQFNRAMQNSSSVQKRSDRLGQAAGELNPVAFHGARHAVAQRRDKNN